MAVDYRASASNKATSHLLARSERQPDNNRLWEVSQWEVPWVIIIGSSASLEMRDMVTYNYAPRGSATNTSMFYVGGLVSWPSISAQDGGIIRTCAASARVLLLTLFWLLLGTCGGHIVWPHACLVLCVQVPHNPVFLELHAVHAQRLPVAWVCAAGRGRVCTPSSEPGCSRAECCSAFKICAVHIMYFLAIRRVACFVWLPTSRHAVLLCLKDAGNLAYLLTFWLGLRWC